MRFSRQKALFAALLLTAAGCGGPQPHLRLVAFSQANNAEPYRAAQKTLMEQLFAPTPDVQLVVSDAQQDNSKLQ